MVQIVKARTSDRIKFSSLSPGDAFMRNKDSQFVYIKGQSRDLNTYNSVGFGFSKGLPHLVVLGQDEMVVPVLVQLVIQ